ncbi:SGNH/GDSL hydrolase family protein [Paenibacillus sp. YIM B09110]|uniref:SGNH/GDSL hydrolase family protein n=1 Tax=Paenibacillus sp. YIM B09110 TaxID=3126102 RepID=UPI00301DF4FD
MVSTGKTILFQGDSITDAGRPREAGQTTLGQGYVNLIAGKLGYEFAESRHRFLNRGVGGNRVSDLYARWNEDAIYLQPDIISILIGVNDVWRIMHKLPEGAVDRFERAYRHLLDETKEVMPNTELILCEPFILQAGVAAEEWRQWRSHLDGYRGIVASLAKQYDALFVALQEPFDQAALRTEPSYWIRDGVHPTAAGHELMAREWIHAVQNSKLAIT